MFKDRQYSFIVNSDDFIHISEHFPTATEIANEVVRLHDVVSNYESVEKKTEGNQKKLVFEKKYPHADIRSVEVVSNNRNSLNLVTVFYTKKNRSQSNPTATSNGNSGPRWGSTSNYSISKTDPNVNTQNSLSAEENLLPTRDFQIRGKDVALENPLPIREDLKTSDRATNTDSQTSYTKDARSERLERKLKRIDKHLEREKAELVEEFKSIDPLAKEMFL